MFEQSISKEIFEKKYCIHEESSVEEVFRGVAKEIASCENEPDRWQDVFYKEMIEGRFLPAGRILANARPDSPMRNYMNCYVIPVEDSMEGIYTALRNDALIGKMGGGVGFNISNLRPRNASISKGGESSGPMCFLDIFDVSAKAIHTGGARRSAHICIMNIDHPDIEEFITYKRGDTNKKLTQFNISVGITDAFMEAVKYDRDWDLQFGGKVYKTVKARYLYDLITENMYKHNEPGVFFLDTVNKNNNGSYMYDINSPNPCVTGDTLILTDRGNVPIESVVGQKVNIWNGFEYSEVEPRITGYDQEIYDIEFSNGSKLSCTPYHKFVLKDQSRIEAKDLKVDDTLSKWNFPIIEGKEELANAYTQGFFSGDGYIHQSDGRLGITLYNEKKELASYLVYNSLNIQKDANTNGKTERIFLNVSGLLISDKNFVPDSRYNINSRLEWFAGILDSDGTRNSKDGAIAISSVDYDFLISIKNMLMTLGVHSTVSLARDRKTSIMPDGKGGLKEYKVKKDYRIVVSAGMVTTLRGIGLTTHRVNIANNINRVASRFVKVRSISKRSEREAKVYCVTEPKNHTVIFGGVMTSNCGEQPLPDFGCCCLGALNLSAFVKNPFTDEAIFNTYEFAQSIHHAVRFLDNVLSTSDYPIPEIKEQVLSERRIGLGFTALADTFTMMGMVYGDDDSIELSHHIGKTLRDESYLKSIALAIEKGTFPNYKHEILKCGFVSKLPEYIKDEISKYGLRNIALNTIAPTGTTSLSIGNNCSSGIEPVFALEYTRNVKQPDDTFIGQQVYSRTYLMWKKLFGDKELPESFITADKIPIEDSVKIQGVFQEYIDASISKTLTLPDEFTLEQYQGLLMDAWNKRLKGITTFNPNGSLAPILSVGEATKKVSNSIAKRDKTVPCDIYELTVNKQEFIVLVGIKNDEPYEVFLTKNNELFNVEKCKQGSVVKMGKGNYKLIMNNGTVINDFTKLLDDDYAIMCRHFSLELRHGIDLRFIVDQLNKTSRFDTFSKAMAQVLKKYIKDDEEVLTEGNCPDCGGKLVYKEGCVTCSSCGYSKC